MGPVLVLSIGEDLVSTNRGSAEASLSSFSTFSGAMRSSRVGNKKRQDVQTVKTRLRWLSILRSDLYVCVFRGDVRIFANNIIYFGLEQHPG